MDMSGTVQSVGHCADVRGASVRQAAGAGGLSA